MWFEEAGEVVEMFRSSFPLSLIFFVPILILISPAPASAAQEFSVFRMQHYDLQGSSYGGCCAAHASLYITRVNLDSVKLVFGGFDFAAF